MTYIISDIHGCYEEYIELLEKVAFSDEDELYILGDCVDRGPEPIKVLRDVMRRSNATLIIGNHDFTAFCVLRKLAVEITEKNVENHLTADDLLLFQGWTQEGGEVTAKQFAKLSREEQQDILEFIADCPIYEELAVVGKKYILVHGGIENFSEDKPMSEYEIEELMFCRPDYDKRYFSDENIFIVSGHTPTPLIRADKLPLVYEENGHIALDCGCVFGGSLAAYCLETGKVTYVRAKEAYNKRSAR